jgi:hypothetical protein
MFTMTPAGVPAALFGVLFMAMAAPVLLRQRGHDAAADMDSSMLRPTHVPATPRADAAAVYGERNPHTTVAADKGDKSGTALKEVTLPVAPTNKTTLPGSVLSPPDAGSSSGVVLVVPPASRESVSTPSVLRGVACYCIEVQIDRDCSIVGQHPSVLDTTLAEKGRPPVTEVVGLKRGLLEYSPGRESSIRGDIKPDDPWGGLRTQPGDLLLVSCLGHVVPKLREMRGVTAVLDADIVPPESVQHHRRRNPRSWRLVEAVVSASSPLSGLSLAEAIALPELEQTIFWGMRDTQPYRKPTVRDGAVGFGTHFEGDGMRWSELYDDGLGAHQPQSAKLPGSRYLREEAEDASTGADPASADVFVLHPGCTLLLEAPAMWVEHHRTSRSFALLGVVGSSPPPSVSPGFLPARILARIRLAFSMLALVAMLLLSALGIADLLPLSLAIAYCLVGLGCITLEQAWRSILSGCFSPSRAPSDSARH